MKQSHSGLDAATPLEDRARGKPGLCAQTSSLDSFRTASGHPTVEVAVVQSPEHTGDL